MIVSPPKLGNLTAKLNINFTKYCENMIIFTATLDIEQFTDESAARIINVVVLVKVHQSWKVEA